ncbi:hypothetical protein HDV00_009838 [Rhizophlyctis rosea]|nr:hypothetical protein HDV00_009838 [Rhizophlyctis rosea]
MKQLLEKFEQESQEQEFEEAEEDDVPDIAERLQGIDLGTLTKVTPSSNLAFNLVDICFSYAFSCRYFNGELTEDTVGTCQILWDLSVTLSSSQPFAFNTAHEAVAAVKNRAMQKQAYGIHNSAIVSLLRDVALILSTQLSTMSALSDIYTLFNSSSRATIGESSSSEPPQHAIPRALRQKAFASTKKVYFYLSFVRSTEGMADSLKSVAEAVKHEVERMTEEAHDLEREKSIFEEQRRRRKVGSAKEPATTEKMSKSLIEEI